MGVRGSGIAVSLVGQRGLQRNDVEGQAPDLEGQAPWTNLLPIGPFPLLARPARLAGLAVLTTKQEA
jgi:hypothetical protein